MGRDVNVYGLELTGDGPDPDDLVEAVVCVVEVLNPEGQKHLVIQSSQPLTAWAEYGMVLAAALSIEEDLRESWQGGPS